MRFRLVFNHGNYVMPRTLQTGLTYQFDQFGVFGYTNIYNPAQRQEFFEFLRALDLLRESFWGKCHY